MTFMDYTRATLQAAHRHSSNHRKELERSEICGCFCCCRTFTAAAVEEWVDDEDGTAICPYCGVDSVLGSASGYPVSEQHFLRAMHTLWFENET
jgi:hypothetical protein